MKRKHSVLSPAILCILLLWTATLQAAVKVTILGGATATREWTEELRKRTDDPEVEIAVAAPEKIPDGTPSQVGSDLLVILDAPTATTKIPGFGIWDKSGNLLWESAAQDDPTAELGTAIRFAKAKYEGLGDGTIRLTVRVGRGAGELGLAEPLRLGLEKILVQNPKIAIAEVAADRAKGEDDPRLDFVLFVLENDIDEAESAVQCQLRDSAKKTLLEVKYSAPGFDGKFFAKLANEVALALKKEALATEAVVVQASRRLKQTGDRLHTRQETSEAMLHLLSGALLNIQDFDLTGNVILELANYSSKIERADLPRFTVGLMQYRLQAIRQLPAKQAALVDFEVGKKPGNRRFYTLGRLNSLVQNAVRSRQTEIEEPWPDDITKLISKLHAEASAELFARWKAVVKDDPKAFGAFTAHLNESQRMMMSYSNGKKYRVGEVDQVVTEMTLDWQKLFDALPKEDQEWLYITRGLQHVTNDTPAAIGDRLEPVWKMLEENDHPLVKLYGLRGRTQHDWDNPEMSGAERVGRYKKLMDAIVVVAKEEKAANRPTNVHTLKELISTFNNNVRYPKSDEISKVQLEYAQALLKEGFIHDVALTQMTNPVDEASAKLALALLRSHSPTDSLARHIQDLEKQYPGLRDSKTLAGMPKVRQILDMADAGGAPGASDILRFLHVRGDSAFGLWVKNPLNPSAVVVKIDLKTGATLSSEQLPMAKPGSYGALLREHLTVGHASETDFFFGGTHIGIYQCGLALDAAPQQILTGAELAARPTALQVVGKQLYIGTADGGLWQYQLDTRKKALLISGKREVRQSKLDGVGVFDIDAILHDEPRSRLLLLAHTKTPELKPITNGIWSLPMIDDVPDPKSLKKLVEVMTPTGNSGYDVSGVLMNDDLLVTSWGLLRWNLKTDKKTLIANASWGSLQPTNHEFLPGVRSPVLCQDSLWWSGFRGDLAESKPGMRTTAHNLDLGEKRFHDSSDTAYVVPLDQKQFLLYSVQRLYVVTPGK